MGMTAAEHSRRYRRRQRMKNGTDGLTLVGPGNVSAVRHGAHSADLDEAAAERLPGLPAYLEQARFREAIALARRRVLMAEQMARRSLRCPSRSRSPRTRRAVHRLLRSAASRTLRL